MKATPGIISISQSPHTRKYYWITL